jgi:hypothetical protein
MGYLAFCAPTHCLNQIFTLCKLLLAKVRSSRRQNNPAGSATFQASDALGNERDALTLRDHNGKFVHETWNFYFF